MEFPELDALEKSLPRELLAKCDHLNSELGIPHSLLQTVIDIANEKYVAILGVEVYEVGDSTSFKDYSDYSFGYREDWREFVRLNNSAAIEFIADNRFKGNEFRYVLTASEMPEVENGAGAPA